MANLNGHEAGNGGHRQGDPKSADRLFSYSAGMRGGIEERSSRQGRSLAGCKSPYRQLPVFGRLAYPMRGEATNRVLLGRKSPGCPAGVFAAVGTIWGASKLGGRNVTKYLQPRKSPRTKSFQAGSCGKPTHFSLGEGRWHRGRNRREHTVYRRGRGSSIQEQTVGDNVGKLPWAAGTGNNLQGLSKRGQKPKEERAQRERRMSLYERRRRSNVLSGDGSRLPNGGNTRVGQRGSGHLAAFSVCLGGRLDKTGTHAIDGSRGEAVGKPSVAGVYTNQRLNFLQAMGKAHGGNAKVWNRTREIWLSGILGGRRETYAMVRL
jgi:hypothetical protein